MLQIYDKTDGNYHFQYFVHISFYNICTNCIILINLLYIYKWLRPPIVILYVHWINKMSIDKRHSRDFIHSSDYIVKY